MKKLIFLSILIFSCFSCNDNGISIGAVFEISQIYPNPVTRGDTISIALSIAEISLEVEDINDIIVTFFTSQKMDTAEVLGVKFGNFKLGYSDSPLIFDNVILCTLNNIEVPAVYHGVEVQIKRSPKNLRASKGQYILINEE
jgi:hypothetical protein